jgi:hypothetical protein
MGHVLAAISSYPNGRSNPESPGQIVRILKKKLFGNSQMENVIISKSVMIAIRVYQLVIAKTKFRSVSPARKLRSDQGFPHISPGRCAMPAWNPSLGFLHHTIGTLNNTTCVHTITDLEMLLWKRTIFQGCTLELSDEYKRSVSCAMPISARICPTMDDVFSSEDHYPLCSSKVCVIVLPHKHLMAQCL